MDNHDIKQIENELQALLQADKANWIRIYQLMNEVDTEGLWKGIERSFTAWVRSLAKRIGIHESLLWSRKKAGGIYTEYAERAAARGETPVAIENLSVSPDSLVFCEKIAHGDNNIKDELIQKTIAGELKREDLRQAWKSRRAEIEDKGMKAVKSNAYTTLDSDELNPSEAKKVNDMFGTTNITSFTAADIVIELRHLLWMTPLVVPVEEQPKHKKPIYHTMPEFPVRTGTSHHARRIDMLIIENLTIKSDDDLVLHGIEIKVSKSDLLNDHKTSEYAPYVDMLWFAVPEHLVDDAISVADDNWGIIALDKAKDEAIIVRAAKKHDAPMRDKTLNTALIKLL